MLNLKNSMNYLEDDDSLYGSDNLGNKSKSSDKWIRKSNLLWSEIADFIIKLKGVAFKDKIGKHLLNARLDLVC
jgi:hypothetical protein